MRENDQKSGTDQQEEEKVVQRTSLSFTRPEDSVQDRKESTGHLSFP